MKKNSAVLHLKGKVPQKIYNVAGKVKLNMETNKSVFPSPKPTMEEFGVEITKLDDAIKAIDGSKIKAQVVVDQANVVYDMLKLLVFYVNVIANGDMAIILQSGFDCNNEPVEHDIPDKALIKRLEDGSVPCSVKIFMDALAYADRYKVDITITPNDAESWKTVIDFGSLKHLEIKDLVSGQKVFIRVAAGNTHGWGIFSEPVSFIPR